jgi:hypothetical protein
VGSGTEHKATSLLVHQGGRDHVVAAPLMDFTENFHYIPAPGDTLPNLQVSEVFFVASGNKNVFFHNLLIINDI